MMAVVKSYLEKTNRPYSANDVFNNLNSKDSKLSKTAVTRALEELAEQEVIKEKVYGKQKVYMADQSAFQDLDQTQLKQMDDQLKELSHRYNQLRSETKAKEDKLSSLKSGLSADELASRVQQLRREVGDLKNRMKDIDNKTQDFDPKLNEQMKNERQTLVKEWRKRKRFATDMIDAILEGYPNSKKALYEELGIETDEDVNVVVPKV